MSVNLTGAALQKAALFCTKNFDFMKMDEGN